MAKFASRIAMELLTELESKMVILDMKKKMIEVLDIEPINKGTMLAKCSVRIIPWKMTLVDVIIFEKGQNRWITMPCKSYMNDAGEKKFIELVKFDTDAIKNRFREQVMEEINAFLTVNPEMKPDDVVTDEELPF